MSLSTDRGWRFIFCGAVLCHGAQPVAGHWHFTLVVALFSLCAQAEIAGAQEAPIGLPKIRL